MPPTYSNTELWIDTTDMTIVTTNGYIRKDGCLVMGRGAAYQATQRIPEIAKLCGNVIAKKYKSVDENIYRYGFLPISDNFGIFQVKYNFRDDADLNLIKESTNDLLELCSTTDTHFRMNFPGIGYGRLSIEKVMPVLDILPWYVTICYKE